MSKQITLAASKLIVFEGLDATGKTTQIARIKGAASGQFGHELFAPPVPTFTHQPSGIGALGEAIYRITEDMQIDNPWCRQFLHLASHAVHYEHGILPWLDSGQPVFMDRCWWSTVAYGYFGGGISTEMYMIPEEFIKMAKAPTMGRNPDIVFLFMEPHKEDPHNNASVAYGYQMLLATEKEYPVVVVPKMDMSTTTGFIFEMLVEYGLA